MAIQVQFQLLTYDVEVTTDDDELGPVLGYLTNAATQDMAVTGSMRYHVSGTGPYELEEDGAHLASGSTHDDVLFILYRRCYGRLLESLRQSGWLPLHGAMVTIADRRVLVVGDKGAGKTTLMLRLLFDGHRVEGDEMVLTLDGVAVPLPRPFHIKPGTDAVIPELAGRLGRFPTTSTDDGTRITAFDPTAAGFPWRITQGPIDGAFVLRSGEGRPSPCSPITGIDLVRSVVQHAMPLRASRPALLHACTSLLGSVDGFDLFYGDVRRSAAALVGSMLARRDGASSSLSST